MAEPYFHVGILVRDVEAAHWDAAPDDPIYRQGRESVRDPKRLISRLPNQGPASSSLIHS